MRAFFNGKLPATFARIEGGRRKILRLIVLGCAMAALPFAGCQSGPGRPDPSATVPSSAIGAEAPPEAYVAEDGGTASLPAPTRPSLPSPEVYRHRSVPVHGPYIALTFDDGPHANLTPRLLDLLKEREVAATFFVLGQRVGAGRGLLRRMVAEGHEIANHGWDHSSLDRMSRSAARDQLMRTSYAIWAAVGEYPSLMRPPYGKTNDRLDQWIYDEMGMKVILWSVDSADWRHKDSGRVEQEIVAGAAPGAIILCHDIQPSTLAAMPAALDRLQARGYRFVTVSQLIEIGRGAGE